MLQKISLLSGKVETIVGGFKDVAILLARLALAYGFYHPAMNKWNNMDATILWFDTMLGIPFPTLNAYLAATTELAGVVLLTLGFLTRLISVPLMVVMVVAITTVHLGNGFEASGNGFEIPLYYLLFLFIFLTHGAGRYSLDNFLKIK